MVESLKRTVARRRYAIIREKARDKIIERYNRRSGFYYRDTIRSVQDQLSSGSLNISFYNRVAELVNLQVCANEDQLKAARDAGEKTVPPDQTIM